MTFQAPDTVILCGHRFVVPQVGYLPSDHEQILDFSKPPPEGIGRRLPKCSALHRGYTAAWEIREDGRLHLVSLTDRFHLIGEPVHASWVSSSVNIPVGEVDRTGSRALRYELVREAELELDVREGVVSRWRLLKGSGKGVRWKPGFEWPQIVAAFAACGIAPGFQPPRDEATRRLSQESRTDIANASAELLERARRGETDTGKVLADQDWDVFHRGWADPFPSHDFHDTVRAMRGHGPTPTAPKP